MPFNVHSLSAPPAGRQRGIATILIILLTGISLAAVVLGLSYYVRSTQEQGMALHAQTQAQLKAWTGAEVVRRYLNVLLENQNNNAAASGGAFDLQAFADAFNGGDELPLSGINGLSAQIVSLDPDANEFVIDITSKTAQDSRAEASSTLRLVYRVAGSGTSEPRNDVLDFMRNLNLGGSIKVVGQQGVKYQVSVKGDVTTGGNSITGINIISSTGSISIGSGSSFDELHANGDIKLTGSVSGEQNLSARGNICLSGGASANGTVRANGSVIGDGGVQFGNISSIGVSDNTGTQLCGSIATDAYGDPWGVDLQGNSSATSVATKGSVRVNSGSIGTLSAEGDLRDTNWGGTEYGKIGGVLRIENSNPQIADWVSIVSGLQVAATPVSEVVIETEQFNAYTLESSANYVFKIDNAGYKVVTVRNISGITDGTYYLGDYDNTAETGWGQGYKDYLCSTLANGSTASAPKCAAPVATPPGTICKAYSTYNKCFAYSNGTWTIDGQSLGQGIAWFQGNLHVATGTYYNTFIATGNITTGGSLNLYAPTFAGYNGTVGGKQYSPTGICVNSNFPLLAPTQFCSGGTFNYEAANGIGHFAMMAGSCTNDSCSPYTGGNITLGASNNIRGSIKAGNQFSSGGSTTVHGYISALAQGENTQNSMGGSTTIKLDELPPGYDPRGANSTPGGSEEKYIQVRWSRYL